MVDRDNRFNVLLSDVEIDMLRSLAERNSLKMSDYLRQLIRREHAKEEKRYEPIATSLDKKPKR
jgi:hypothetical protein